jgi:hypothetical protein
MGRPLNKRFFGNRNTGSASTTADNGIGGGAVASVSNPAEGVGSFVVTNTYKNFPTLTAAAPTLPGGVRALLTPVFEIDTVTFASGGQTAGDYLAGLSTTITGLGGGAVVRIVETANVVTSVDLVGGNRGEFRRGDFDGTGITTHQVLQAPNAGTDLQITVTFRVKSIEVTEAGSGYVSAPALTWGGHTFTDQTTPSLNVVTMLVDSGALNTTNATSNQQNAIIAYAYVTGNNLIADITKQVSGRRYKVKTSEGTLTCKLVTDGVANAVGEMTITATDVEGNTYYVSKLTRHKATLVQIAGGEDYVYETNEVAPWSFAAAAGSVVQIENA